MRGAEMPQPLAATGPTAFHGCAAGQFARAAETWLAVGRPHERLETPNNAQRLLSQHPPMPAPNRPEFERGPKSRAGADARGGAGRGFLEWSSKISPPTLGDRLISDPATPPRSRLVVVTRNQVL